MSFFKRLWATPKKDEAAPAMTAGSETTPDAGAVPLATERRIRKRINACKGSRALIIDDSPTIVAALKKILRSAGYLTLEALDAEKGMDLVRLEKPDLIFLDIILPGMNGFAALRLIRKDPVMQHIPVIMISGNEHATEQFYANRIGADDFMKKPFSRFEVFARIENLLDAERMPRRKALAVNEATAVPVPTPALPVLSQPPVLPEETPAEPPVSTPLRLSPTDARKELTAMGLQYFDQSQYLAAVGRGDKLAVELFITGGGVSVKTTEAGHSSATEAKAGNGTVPFP
jgi:twitching motility two-component system response regulator PilH